MGVGPSLKSTTRCLGRVEIPASFRFNPDDSMTSARSHPWPLSMERRSRARLGMSSSRLGPNSASPVARICRAARESGSLVGVDDQVGRFDRRQVNHLRKHDSCLLGMSAGFEAGNGGMATCSIWEALTPCQKCLSLAQRAKLLMVCLKFAPFTTRKPPVFPRQIFQHEGDQPLGNSVAALGALSVPRDGFSWVDGMPDSATSTGQRHALLQDIGGCPVSEVVFWSLLPAWPCFCSASTLSFVLRYPLMMCLHSTF